MTVDKQPRALYLADVLAAGFECDQEWYKIESAKELRRLYAENDDFRATCDHLTRENAEQIGEIVALKEQRDELRNSVKRLHAAKGRHHTQHAICDLFDLVGLKNERPTK